MMTSPRLLHRTLLLPIVLVTLAIPGCEEPQPAGDDPINVVREESVGGCDCPGSGGCTAVSYSDIPSNNSYYITTFGGGADTQGMSCGGTADGTWAYIADKARFGCGAKVKVSAKGKSCIAKVADCGPNKCVEQAASYSSCSKHHPIIDASPFITKYLFGTSGVGWSDKRTVTAELVDKATPIGCPGGPEPAPKLDAKFISQGSDSAKDSTAQAFYQVCPGEALHFWFELQNTGSAAWVDLGSNGNSDGEDVRLGVPGDKTDPLTGLTRVSINQNANNNAISSGGDCNDQPKCRRTVFSKTPGIAGKAPATPGVYKTSWQLVDEGRAWFGPGMYLTYRVLDATDPSCTPSSDGGASTDGGVSTDAQTGSDARADAKADSGVTDAQAGKGDASAAPGGFDSAADDGGCGCRFAGSTRSWPGLIGAMVVGLALARRRKPGSLTR